MRERLKDVFGFYGTCWLLAVLPSLVVILFQDYAKDPEALVAYILIPMLVTVFVVIMCPFVVLLGLAGIFVSVTKQQNRFVGAAVVGAPSAVLVLGVLYFTAAPPWLLGRGRVSAFADQMFDRIPKYSEDATPLCVCFIIASTAACFLHILVGGLNHYFQWKNEQAGLVMDADGYAWRKGRGCQHGERISYRPPWSGEAALIADDAKHMKPCRWWVLFPALFFGIPAILATIGGDPMNRAWPLAVWPIWFAGRGFARKFSCIRHAKAGNIKVADFTCTHAPDGKKSDGAFTLSGSGTKKKAERRQFLHLLPKEGEACLLVKFGGKHEAWMATGHKAEKGEW